MHREQWREQAAVVVVDPHRIAELRSLAYHRAVAERLDTQIIETAKTRARGWAASGQRWGALASRWLELLEGPLDELVSTMIDPSQESAQLRSATPFAGALPPRERWALWRKVREEAEAR